MKIIVSPTTDTQITNAPNRADGCPECVYNVELPVFHGHTLAGCACTYRCSDCGHEWTTYYKIEVGDCAHP